MQEWSRPVSRWADATGNNTSGGYQCAGCAAWVPHGEIHSCVQYPKVDYPKITVNGWDYDKVARALERIAEALEKLAEVEK